MAFIKHSLIDAVAAESTLHITAVQTRGNAEILADIYSLDRRQTDIENIVNKLSSLNEVTAIKWEEVKPLI
jgi:hypothetical protein